MATSLRMGISTEQSRPSRRAMRGRGCIGPLGMGPRGPDTGRTTDYNYEDLLLNNRLAYLLYLKVSDSILNLAVVTFMLAYTVSSTAH